MAVRRPKTINSAVTTLNGAVLDSDTTWTVTDGSIYPSEGQFWLACENEIVLCTARSTNDLTVDRAQQGTVAAAYGAGREVYSLFTEDELTDRISAIALPSQDLAIPYGRILDKDGNQRTASDFSLINSSASSVFDGNQGVIIFECETHSSNEVTGITVSRGSDNFSVTAHMCGVLMDGGSGGDWLGIYARQTSGGAMRGIVLRPDYLVQVQSKATFLASPTPNGSHQVHPRRDIWLKGSRSGNNFTWQYSLDGVTYWSFGAANSMTGGVTIGMWAHNSLGIKNQYQLLSWVEDA